MSAIFMKEQGAVIRQVSERLLMEKNGKTMAELPVSGISSLSVFGNVQVTTQAVRLLLERGIDIAYFTYSGRFLGQISPDSSKNVFLRFAQYELYQDAERRAEMGRTIAANKIANQIAVLRSFRFEDYDPKEIIKKITETAAGLPEKHTSNEIMGAEGSCSAAYFSAFSHMFRNEIRFEKRTRRPPRDPVNVILSLGYTFLTREVASVLEAESFETYLGFLHGIRYGRKSLPLDIVEEFRQPVVDRLVLRLFNKRMLDVFDFDREQEEILLNESGFRKFCTAYERWMKEPVSRKDSRSFRSIIRIQASQLKHAVREHKPYVPYRWEPTDVSDQL